MALLNNLLEIRADAFKITVHQRRPVPVRSDTIGPWLSALEGLAWAAALTNAALVYLFRPQSAADPRTTTLNEDHPYTAEALGRAPQSTRELLIGAATVALVASHGAILARAVIRHVLVRTLWSTDPRVADADRVDRQAKQEYMDTIGLRIDGGVKGQAALPSGGAFWENDEGLDEVRRGVKDA
jgi:anoctamin-10